MSKTAEYIAARAEFVSVDDRRTATAETIKTIGEALRRDPMGVHFSDTGVSLPAEVTMKPGPYHLHVNGWETAESIMSLLKEWHDARQKVLSLWENLTADEREAMKEPPENARLRASHW